MNDGMKDERGDKILPILKQDKKIIHQQSFIEGHATIQVFQIDDAEELESAR